MKWNKVDNYGKMSRVGAERLFNVIYHRLILGQSANIGMATGITMIKLYAILAGMLNQSKLDLSKLSTFNLDEYLDNDGGNLSQEHFLSYRRYMKEHFYDLLDPILHFNLKNIFFPDSYNPKAYDYLIEEIGGIDIQLLGIGFNGHIGFNEPIDENKISKENFVSLPSRIVDLDQTTILTNAKLTAGNDSKMIPRQAVTLGMSSILKAKKIVLLACFREQVQPLRNIKSGVITSELPASFLLNHNDTEIIYTRDKIWL